MPAEDNVVMEGVRIIFRNFSGKEGQYNREGDRNFGVILPDGVAEAMLADGWNVKYLKPREGDDEELEEATPYIQVSVNFKNRPPTIVVITSRARTRLSEDTVATLDWAEFKTVDLICNPYNWEVGDKSGVKAYLKSLYVTIEEDALELKYAVDPEG